MTKKIERLHKENMVLQHKIDDYAKKDPDDTKEVGQLENMTNHQVIYWLIKYWYYSNVWN